MNGETALDGECQSDAERRSNIRQVISFKKKWNRVSDREGGSYVYNLALQCVDPDNCDPCAHRPFDVTGVSCIYIF